MIPLPLETERLLVRRFERDDAAALSVIFGDPEVMRYIPFGVLEPAGVAELVDRYRSSETLSFWALVEKASGRLVGDVGLKLYEPTREPELGYTLAREVWGRGYATEASRACVDAAFAHLGAQRVLAVIDVRNHASQRVAERLGMTQVETIEPGGVPHGLYTVERP